MVKKIEATPSFFDRYFDLQKKREYIEDPTYSRSIGSHVCMTCSKFAFLVKKVVAQFFVAPWHQKLIFHGEHLTHSCGLYQKKQILH